MSNKTYNSNPKLTIIVPIYNIEQYLRECIDSIVSQSYNNYELLLIDDGSTDSSASICDEYSEIENVRVFHVKNGGVSYARNIGLENAKGEFIFFIDGDDVLPDNQVLRDIMKYARAGSDTILRFCVSEFSGYTKPIIDDPIDLTIKEISNSERICSGIVRGYIINYIFSKELIQDLRFDEKVKLREDLLFLSKILPRVKTLYECNRVIYCRRIREGSAVYSELDDQYFDNSAYAYKQIKDNLKSVKGGNKVFEALYADQTIAIQKIRRNYRTQKNSIKKIRDIVYMCFPHFILNTYLSIRTKTLLILFLINPSLFYTLYSKYKKS